MKTNSIPLAYRRVIGLALPLAALFTLPACGTLDKINPFSKSSKATEEPAKATGGGPQTGYAGGHPVTISDPDAKRVTQFVSQSQFGYVRIERIEDGAQPNDHPYKVTATQLKSVLANLQVQKSGDPDPIFTEEEQNEVAAPLAIALGKAGPSEDVTFAVSGKRGPVALLMSRTVTTGRMFVKNGAINIIFNDIHGEFENQFLATGWLRPFVAGSRNSPAPVNVVAPPGTTYAAGNRRDWILLAESTVPPPLAPLARDRTTPGVAPVAPQGDYYQDVEKRLTILKGLKDKGLITEQEYDDKRKEILKGL